MGLNILHYACQSGSMQLGQVLINEYGLDPCTLTHDNISVMSLVVVCHYCNTLISIISRSHGGTEFCCWAGWWLAGCVTLEHIPWQYGRRLAKCCRQCVTARIGSWTALLLIIPHSPSYPQQAKSMMVYSPVLPPIQSKALEKKSVPDCSLI